MKIAFIGLGTMGAPIAKRFAGARHDLSVFDISAEARSAFDDLQHCRVAISPKDAAIDADVVITMLPESQHVRAALLGEDGAVQSLRAGALVVDMSTGSVPAINGLAAELSAHSVRLIDAPVGRSPKEAATGNLLVMAGGADEDLREITPLLQIIGDEIVHAGPLGSGLKLKLVNNYMSMIGMVVTAEALNMADRLGLDQNQTVHVLQSTPAGRGQINTNFPNKVLSGDISPDFPLQMGLKDIGLGLDLAQSVGAPTPIGSASKQMFALAAPWGRAGQDCTAMLHLFADLSGASLQTDAHRNNTNLET